MKIHGKEIDFKHTRLEDAKRFEKAVSNMAYANEKYKKTGHSMSEYIRWQIGVYSKFFIDATKIDVLKGCKDVQEAEAAYYDFLGKIQAEQALAVVRRSCIAKKYENLAEAVKKYELAPGTAT